MALGDRAKGILDLLLDPSKYDDRFEVRNIPKVKPRDQYFEPVVEPYQPNLVVPEIKLSDLEGRPYLSTMSDRTSAEGILTGIGDKELAYPINLTGGQDFMAQNPEMWASAPSPVSNMTASGRDLKRKYGTDPVFMPWRMSPSGSDFAAEMTAGTMMSYAAKNMPKADKKALDKRIKEFVPDFVGVDSPAAPAQIQSQPDKLRKFIQQQIMDKQFRDRGGISLPQARIAIADQTQLNAPELGFQNVGIMDVDAGALTGRGNRTYPDAVGGEFLGRLNTDAGLLDLAPTNVYPAGSKDAAYGRSILEDKYGNVRDLDTSKGYGAARRSAEINPYGGLIDEKLLRSLEKKGFNISALAGAGVLGGMAATQSEDVEANPTQVIKNLTNLKGKGYDTDNVFYHASKQDIGEFKAGYSDGLVFLTPQAEFANNWIGKGKFRERQGQTKELEKLRSKQYDLRRGIFAKYNLDQLNGDEFNDAYDRAAAEFREAAKTEGSPEDAYSAVYPVFVRAKKTFNPQAEPELVREIIERESRPDPVLDSNGNPTGDVYVNTAKSPDVIDAFNKGHYMMYETPKVIEFLKSKGYDSIKLAENNDGVLTTLAMFSPKDIRSVNAKGKKDNTADILATTAGAGLLGAGLTQSEDVEANPAQVVKNLANLKGKGYDIDNVFYHGTPMGIDFTKFDYKYAGKGNDQFGAGFYLTNSPSQASGYAGQRIEGQSNTVIPTFTKNANLLEVDGTKAGNLGDVLNLDYEQTKKILEKSKALKRGVDDEDMNPFGDRYESFWDEGPEDWMYDQLAKDQAGRDPDELATFFEDDMESYLKALSDVTGYDGLAINFGDGVTNQVHWNAQNIRSVNAKGEKSNTANLLASVGGAGLLGAGLTQSEDAEASFLGEVSKLGASRSDLKGMAEKMLSEGVDPQLIWKNTGWEFNVGDGKWRTELPNTETKINLPTERNPDRRYAIEEFLDDPELLSQYDLGVNFLENEINLDDPFDSLYGSRRRSPLSNVAVVFNPEIEAGGAAYDAFTDTIYMPVKVAAPKEDRGAFLHELQHAIQEREGFSTGSSPDRMQKLSDMTNSFNMLTGDGVPRGEAAIK